MRNGSKGLIYRERFIAFHCISMASIIRRPWSFWILSIEKYISQAFYSYDILKCCNVLALCMSSISGLGGAFVQKRWSISYLMKQRHDAHFEYLQSTLNSITTEVPIHPCGPSLRSLTLPIHRTSTIRSRHANISTYDYLRLALLLTKRLCKSCMKSVVLTEIQECFLQGLSSVDSPHVKSWSLFASCKDICSPWTDSVRQISSNTPEHNMELLGLPQTKNMQSWKMCYWSLEQLCPVSYTHLTLPTICSV